MSKTVNVKFYALRGSSTQWTSNNPILGSGELGYDTTIGILKVGDGVTAWNNLMPISEENFTLAEKLKLLSLPTRTELDDALETLLPTIAESDYLIDEDILTAATLIWENEGNYYIRPDGYGNHLLCHSTEGPFLYPLAQQKSDGEMSGDLDLDSKDINRVANLRVNRLIAHSLGKNLFDFSKTTNANIQLIEDGYRYTSYQTLTGIMADTFLEPNTVYTCSRIYTGGTNGSAGDVGLWDTVSGKPKIDMCERGAGFKFKTFTTPDDLSNYQVQIYGTGSSYATMTEIQVEKGDTFTGYERFDSGEINVSSPVFMDGEIITGLSVPVNNTDATNKQYVDDKIGDIESALTAILGV